MSDAIQITYSKFWRTRPSSDDCTELIASALNAEVDTHLRLRNYAHIRQMDVHQSLSVTMQLLSSSSENDTIKTLVLVCLLQECRSPDALATAAANDLLAVSDMLQKLPPHLGGTFTGMCIRAYLGDETSFSSSAALRSYERIKIAGNLQTPDAMEYLRTNLTTLGVGRAR